MSPAEAQGRDLAQAYVVRCFDILTVISLALDRDPASIGARELEAIAATVRTALDQADAARMCFPGRARP